MGRKKKSKKKMMMRSQTMINNTIQGKEIKATDFRVVFDDVAYQKIMYYVHKSSHEVSGFGQVLYDEATKTFRVTDAFLINQENTGTSSEIDGAAMAKAMFKRKDIPNGLKIHWHSHVNMTTFWSGDDMNIIRGLGQQSWIIAGVFNKRNESRLCFYQLTDVMGHKHEVFVDQLPVSVIKTKDPSVWDRVNAFGSTLNLTDKLKDEIYALIDNSRDIDPALVAAWDKEYDECVKEKRYVTNYYSSEYSKSGPNLWDRNKEWVDDWNKRREKNWSDWEKEKAFSQKNWVDTQLSQALPMASWDKDGYKARVDGTLMYNPVRDKSLTKLQQFDEAINLSKQDYDELMEEDPMFKNFMNDSFNNPGVYP